MTTTEYQAVLADLAQYLDFELQEGRATAVVPAEVVRALTERPAAASAASARPALSAPMPPARPAPVRPVATPSTPAPAPVRPVATTPAPAPVAPAAPVVPPPAAPRPVAPVPSAAGYPPPAGEIAAARDGLAEIAKQVAACKKCSLCSTRTKTVPGQGHPRPQIMFIGEAPGADEDAQGLAFVGRAGQLLTKMIEAMGLTRDEVFIGNILKCRPPDNRTPLPGERASCLPFLKAQIKLLQPQVIVALGATAISGLLDLSTGISKLRGKWLLYEGIDLMPTFHPAYLLRNPSSKREAWEDLKSVLKRLGREPPPVKKA